MATTLTRAVERRPLSTPPPRRRRTPWWPYLLIAPTVLAMGFLLLYPLVRNVVMSVQEFGLPQLVRGGARFVGLANYTRVLSDPEFWAVVRRTLVFTAINVVLIMVLSTLVALLLVRLGRWTRLLVMSGLVLVWATPVIAATTVFQWLFQSRLGVVNWVLVSLGFEGYRDYTWFADGPATFGILVALIVWQSVPFAALSLYAAMVTVPSELYEAARMDGAGAWREFASITFPVLRAMFGLITCLEVIWVAKCFVQIWVISQGGPGQATTTLPVYAFQVAQSLQRYDLGAAVSMLMVLLLVLALLAYFRQMYRQEEVS
ncbi:N,N'-diacetylchitobiose transport system permease protein [Saccharothrix ecbatanensis]|uniref:N,N'-diacetylchitobiose transport system permease protein n=1 Tax=Saccharothrix ecbatanensis TaxID=1105145 RepID=A0A7W9HHD0_9PSEU|nr:sugar ABC transporter permease [Saccharothrix ecbatanensis]MBB5802323.1 N,N'-diacetylchitobiose transport system permease protein [Saccharothrix ecbatanensis]